MTADTIVQAPYDPQSLNRYAYCRNNPIKYVDPTGHSWFKKFFSKIAGFFAAVITFAGTGGNAAAAFTAFNVVDTFFSGARAIAHGAPPGRIFAAIGISLTLNTIIPFPDIGNLALQLTVAAARGAFISVATNAIINKGGKLGSAAAWGAGMGAVSGFLGSQQYQNWRKGKGFVSNKQADARRKARNSARTTSGSVKIKKSSDGRAQDSLEVNEGRIVIARGDKSHVVEGAKAAGKAAADTITGVPAFGAVEIAGEMAKTLPKVMERNQRMYEEYEESGLGEIFGPNPWKDLPRSK
ncbi:MAG: hypothetical protein JSV30_04555 [Candidatus Omnitrophota bacterium]|nr:MAG: hypothetical protein JSV30_04555 [Candidatus Omnitrophota bacterium]